LAAESKKLVTATPIDAMGLTTAGGGVVKMLGTLSAGRGVAVATATAAAGAGDALRPKAGTAEPRGEVVLLFD